MLPAPKLTRSPTVRIAEVGQVIGLGAVAEAWRS